MSMRVIENACKFASDKTSGVVVVESDCGGPPFDKAFDELQTQAARQLAQEYAGSQGVAPAYLNGNVIGPYPVNHEGVPLEQITDGKGTALPANHPKMRPQHYRIDVPVCRPLR